MYCYAVYHKRVSRRLSDKALSYILCQFPFNTILQLFLGRRLSCSL